MADKSALYELIEKMEGGENVEVITVEKEGENSVLLRSKEMPEFAFLMWPKPDSVGTYTNLVFKLVNYGESEKYTLVSGKYASEFYGIEDVSDRPIKELQKEYREKFIETISSVCIQNGIKIVFVERIDNWIERYGNINEVRFADISDHQNEMLELYGRKKIRESLRFINYEKSRGYWENLIY